MTTCRLLIHDYIYYFSKYHAIPYTYPPVCMELYYIVHLASQYRLSFLTLNEWKLFLALVVFITSNNENYIRSISFPLASPSWPVRFRAGPLEEWKCYFLYEEILSFPFKFIIYEILLNSLCCQLCDKQPRPLKVYQLTSVNSSNQTSVLNSSNLLKAKLALKSEGMSKKK